MNKAKPIMLEGIEVVDRFDYLKKSLSWIIKNNKSNGVPYHNLNHLLTVVKLCYEAVTYYGTFEDKEIRSLLLAAIFHDVNHSGGKTTDDLNVWAAKDGFMQFIKESKLYTDIDTDKVCEIIDATQYPYVIDRDDLTILQAIIRDADLLQTTEPNWIHQIILGLSNEMKIDFPDMVKGQRAFLEAAEFNTDWGRMMKTIYWDSVMEQFEMLERVLNVEV